VDTNIGICQLFYRLSQKNIKITWGYYLRVGMVMTIPVLFVTLAALALRLSFTF